MVRRATAREFQKSFQRLEEPVLVNDGIYFPKATSELMAIAEGKTQVVLSNADRDRFLHPSVVQAAVSTTNIKPSTTNRPLPDLSKSAQVKGKMR